MVSNGIRYHESNRLDATATGADEIGTAFQKVGGTASALGLSFEQVSSWIAVISSKTRESADTIGDSIKSMLARMQQIKSKGFSSEDGTKFNQVAQALSKVGIAFTDSTGQMRNFGDIMNDLGAKWSGLDKKTQAYIATTVAGTYQQSRFLNLMNGYQQTLTLTQGALNSAGTTQEKYNTYLQGTQAHLDGLKQSLQAVWSQSFNSENIKSGIDLLTSISNGLFGVIHYFGLANVALGTLTAGLLTFGKSGRSGVLAVEAELKNLIFEGSLTSGMSDKFVAFKTSIVEAGRAIKLAGEEFKTATSSGVTFRNVITGIRGAMVALSASEIVARVSTIALQTTLTLGLSVAITALISLFGKLVSWMAQSNSKAQELQKTNENLAISYNNHATEIKSLIDQYDQLQKKQANGTFNSDDQQQYLNVTQQLAQLMPQLVDHTDAQGNAVLKSNKAMQDTVDTAQKLAKAYNDANIAKFNTDMQAIAEQAKGATEKLKETNAQLEELNNRKTPYAKGTIGDQEKNQAKNDLIQQQIEDQKNYNDIIQQGINRAKDNFNELIQNAEGYSKLTSASQNYLKTVADIQSKKITNPLDQKAIQDATVSVNRAESDIINLENAVANAWNKSGHDFGNFRDQIQSLGKEAVKSGVPISVFDQIIYQLTGHAVDASTNLQDLNETTKALNQTMQDMADDASKTYSALGDLNDAVDQLNQGHQLSAKTILDLIDKYPNLISSIKNENGVLELSKTAIEAQQHAEIASFIARQQARKSDLEDLKTHTEEKIAIYQKDLESLQAVVEATHQANDLMKTDANKAIAIAKAKGLKMNFSMDKPITFDVPDVDKELLKAKSTLTKINGQIAGIDAVTSWATDSSNGKGLTEPTTKNSGSNTSTQPAKADKTPAYLNDLNKVNQQLKDQADNLRSVDKASQAYRDGLQEEIGLYGKKIDAMKEEYKYYQNDIKVANDAKATAKTKAQKDALTKRINDDEAKMNQIANKDIPNVEQQIRDTNARIKVSQNEAHLNSLQSKLTPLQNQAENLQNALDLIPQANTKAYTNILGQQGQNAEAQYNLATKTIAQLEAESKSLDKNKQEWKDNQNAIIQWKKTRDEAAKSIKSTRDALTQTAVDNLNNLANEDQQRLQKIQEDWNKKFASMQKVVNTFDMSDFTDSMGTISEDLDVIDNKFTQVNKTMTSEDVRNKIQELTKSITDFKNQANDLMSKNSDNMSESALETNITSEINLVNQLKDAYSKVQAQIKQTTLEFKAQEDALQNQIDQTTKSYDDQVSAKQEELKLLQQEYQTQSDITKLQDLKNQLTQAEADKRFSYIDSTGKETLTYDAKTVDDIKKQISDAQSQFAEKTKEDAIQAQIDALNTAKNDKVTALKNQLDALKKVHSDELSAMKAYADNLSNMMQNLNNDINDKNSVLQTDFQKDATDTQSNWDKIVQAVQNGTINVSDILLGKGSLGGWYKQHTDALQKFSTDTAGYVANVVDSFNQLTSLKVPDWQNVTGTSLSNGGSSPTTTKTTANTPTTNNTAPTSNPNTWMTSGGSTGGVKLVVVTPPNGKPVSATSYDQAVNLAGGMWQNGKWVSGKYINGTFVPTSGNTTGGTLVHPVEQFHTGGVVGGGATNKTVDLVNKLLNTKPNETTVKALIGEVFSPEQNIMSNFVPNMKTVGNILAGKSNNAVPQVNQKNFNIYGDIGVKANNPEELLSGIEHYIGAQNG